MLKDLGRTVAPPRFVLFCLLFPAATAGCTTWLPLVRAVLAGFSVAALAFLLLVAPLLRHGQADQMREATRRNDANRTMLLGITGAIMLVVLTAVTAELQGNPGPWSAALVVGTLALAWLFSNTVYALHYAHIFYGDTDNQDGDDRGIDFPDCDEPDYWDFIYFSFTLGMTFQTSDVEIKSQRVRRIATGHCLAAFVFNLGVLAFTINVLGK